MASYTDGICSLRIHYVGETSNLYIGSSRRVSNKNSIMYGSSLAPTLLFSRRYNVPPDTYTQSFFAAKRPSFFDIQNEQTKILANARVVERILTWNWKLISPCLGKVFCRQPRLSILSTYWLLSLSRTKWEEPLAAGSLIMCQVKSTAAMLFHNVETIWQWSSWDMV